MRNVTFTSEGAVFDSAVSGIDYPSSLFPAEGTVEFILKTDGSASQGFIMDTQGIGGRRAGDAVLMFSDASFAPATDLAFFTIDPYGGTNPLFCQPP